MTFMWICLIWIWKILYAFEYENATIASKRTKQITTILDGLLQDYQAHIRPNFGGELIEH